MRQPLPPSWRPERTETGPAFAAAPQPHSQAPSRGAGRARLWSEGDRFADSHSERRRPAMQPLHARFSHRVPPNYHHRPSAADDEDRLRDLLLQKIYRPVQWLLDGTAGALAATLGALVGVAAALWYALGYVGRSICRWLWPQQLRPHADAPHSPTASSPHPSSAASASSATLSRHSSNASVSSLALDGGSGDDSGSDDGTPSPAPSATPTSVPMRRSAAMPAPVTRPANGTAQLLCRDFDSSALAKFDGAALRTLLQQQPQANALPLLHDDSRLNAWTQLLLPQLLTVVLREQQGAVPLAWRQLRARRTGIAIGEATDNAQLPKPFTAAAQDTWELHETQRLLQAHAPCNPVVQEGLLRLLQDDSIRLLVESANTAGLFYVDEDDVRVPVQLPWRSHTTGFFWLEPKSRDAATLQLGALLAPTTRTGIAGGAALHGNLSGHTYLGAELLLTDSAAAAQMPQLRINKLFVTSHASARSGGHMRQSHQLHREASRRGGVLFFSSDETIATLPA